MTEEKNAGWRPLELSRDLALVGRDGRALHRAAASSRSIKLRRGVYVDATGWPDIAEYDKYLLRMRAVAATRKVGPIFSHYSAAIVWGLPIIGRWPHDVHLMADGRRGVHSKNGVIWHHDLLREGDVVERDGMLVTSLLRTLVDLARSTPFLSAVASLDYGTKAAVPVSSGRVFTGVERDELLERLASDGPRRGTRAARIALTFSDNRSGSPGESLSRGQIHLCGFPAPELQVSFVSPEGIEDIVDFRWLQKQGNRMFELIGEFDGKVKYGREEYLNGRSPEEVLWAEKLREDRLRANTRHGMVRWIWEIALNKERLRARLLQAGLHPER